eukprot:scaffold4990_cov176-Amphora_coffeaeformis.AAC.16
MEAGVQYHSYLFFLLSPKTGGIRLLSCCDENADRSENQNSFLNFGTLHTTSSIFTTSHTHSIVLPVINNDGLPIPSWRIIPKRLGTIIIEYGQNNTATLIAVTAFLTGRRIYLGPSAAEVRGSSVSRDSHRMDFPLTEREDSMVSLIVIVVSSSWYHTMAAFGPLFVNHFFFPQQGKMNPAFVAEKYDEGPSIRYGIGEHS